MSYSPTTQNVRGQGTIETTRAVGRAMRRSLTDRRALVARLGSVRLLAADVPALTGARPIKRPDTELKYSFPAAATNDRGPSTSSNTEPHHTTPRHATGAGRYAA